jgi:hypothetical protein
MTKWSDPRCPICDNVIDRWGFEIAVGEPKSICNDCFLFKKRLRTVFKDEILVRLKKLLEENKKDE